MLRAVLNGTRVYSPVMLNHEWPRIGRLLFTVVCSAVGTIMNGFFVASFFVEDSLRRTGLVFMACAGFADCIITSAVMPISSVVLLSGEWDIDPVCYSVQILTEGATYCYCIFSAMSAIETFYKICMATVDYEAFVSRHIGIQACILFIICYGTAFAGVYYELDYDYCHRSHVGNMIFRLTTSVIFHAIPFLITIYCLLRAGCRIREKASRHAHYKRSALYERETIMTNLNIAAFLLFVVAWIPYLIIVIEYPDTTDSKYYNSAWIGVCRSLVSSFLYGFIDIGFRRAFAHLFNYCCCKSTLSGSFASRHRRAVEYKSGSGDVRVHIMHQAVNANSPQRGASTSRETQEL